jgi:hypothetical protein
MALPFTTEQFLEVFRRYNHAVCPFPAALWLLGVGAGVAAWRANGSRSGLVVWVLALLWAWSGLVFQLVFFRTINPMAPVFAALFVAEAGLVLAAGRGGHLTFTVRRDASGMIGGALVLYALVLYPMLSFVLGHRYPATPTFGAPCPVTILTFGLLAWTAGTAPRWLLVIPAAWAVIGTSAALTLGMREDLALPLAAILVLLLFVSQRSPLAVRAATSR